MASDAALVKIRGNDPYVARCEGQTASSTSAPEVAAERAAARHFDVAPRQIRLRPNADGSFLAIPESASPSDWPSASTILRERIAKLMRRRF
jgi:hypothetical protein